MEVCISGSTGLHGGSSSSSSSSSSAVWFEFIVRLHPLDVERLVDGVRETEERKRGQSLSNCSALNG